MKKLPPQCQKKVIDVDKILELISSGMSTMKACKECGTKKDRLFDRLEEFGRWDDYTHAQEKRGDAYADKIDEIEDELRQGLIDAQTARVLIDSQKWKACKFFPRMFGERVQTQFVDAKGNDKDPFESFYKAVCETKDYVK